MQMVDGPASFATQADALLRKNLTFQIRNKFANCRLISFPIVLLLLFFAIQTFLEILYAGPEFRCGCKCIDRNGGSECEKVCGMEQSDDEQIKFCAIPKPQKWPPLMQVPNPESRAVSNNLFASQDFQKDTCKKTDSCPATILLTGKNSTFGTGLARILLTNDFVNTSDLIESLATNVMGTSANPGSSNFFESAFLSDRPLYNLRKECTMDPTLNISITVAGIKPQQEIICVQGWPVWRNSSSEINNVLYKGYSKGNKEEKTNAIVGAYDLMNSNARNFNVTVWYNSTFKARSQSLSMLRVPRTLNLVSNAYLQTVKPGSRIIFEFVKEMPKAETGFRADVISLMGSLFFTWVILQLFPVVLGAVVYEKQKNLRIMMKMHGLGDGPYWMISYGYFLLTSSIYMTLFVVFGYVLGLKVFTLNDLSIQFLFYFIYINVQIAMAFLVAGIFSDVKTATVVAYIAVFGTGLLGAFAFEVFLQDVAFPREWIMVMELYPGFALYRGLYELTHSSFTGDYMGTRGITWANLNEKASGLKEVMILMFIEWWFLLVVAYYIDKVVAAGSGVRRSPLYCLQCFRKTPVTPIRQASSESEEPEFDQTDKPDVQQEIEKVQRLLLESNSSYAIISDNLKKIYPGTDGNPPNYAVKGMSLALPKAECFGLLGTNGAGKTSFINMMIGLMPPTSGAAYVRGLDIRTQMDLIYNNIGVCPQHDLLWGTLTGREHLHFYGRLKNLKGSDLNQAVEESLKSVNLTAVGDKLARMYSRGMKRRLSVAISLIGDPKVVYMDEPSTGLDPGSRNILWNVVRQAKQDRAIVLTTHSMEEAEALCDRLGIYVDGCLQCIGNTKELKDRYGGSYIFTMTTSSLDEEEVEKIARRLSPNAHKIYQLSGTQKFELQKQDVRIADVFEAVEHARQKFTVQAWGISDTTLEDVFIKVAHGAQAFQSYF